MPERIRNDIDRDVLRLGDGRPGVARDVCRECNRQFCHFRDDFKGLVYTMQRGFILFALVLAGNGYNREQVRLPVGGIAREQFFDLPYDFDMELLAGLVTPVGQYPVLNIRLFQEGGVYE